MDYLNKQQESFCENAGLFGVMIAASCLIQMMVVMLPHWIPFTVIAGYIFCIIAFVLLMKKSAMAFRLLFISTVLIFLMEILMFFSLTFSLVLFVLLVYLLVIVLLLYMGEIPKRLQQKNIAEKEEAEKWNGIV
jgi:predicted membrane protein